MDSKRSRPTTVPTPMQGKADWRHGFIAVDWGTTNRRAYRVLADGGREVLLEDGCGILSVPDGDFATALGQIRDCAPGLPMLLAGMIGSNRGWIEAPYVPAPAGADALARAIRWAEDGVGIVPGVSWQAGESADVMRGEEVQILGARAAGRIGEDALVCHPGTHAKWIRVENGAIGPFRTVMTGELFNLLKTHSILAALLTGDVVDGPSFRHGVTHALDNDDLTAELFSVRARHLLAGTSASDSASYASGLLIGADVRTGLALGGPARAPIALIGRPDLTALYAAALDCAGAGSLQIDGEEAFLAGARAIAELLA